jgi:glycogen debranching enzyme
VKDQALNEAYRLLDASLIHYRDCPVGTAAAIDPTGLAADNYRECFIRDFAVSGLVFLADGRWEIVRDFLLTSLEVTEREHSAPEQTIHHSVMPASFHVHREQDGKEYLRGDFGEQAIGRVAPVDSIMWWTLLLCATMQTTGDRSLAERPDVQRNLRRVLALCANDSFEVYPTLMVPDGAFMVDRRMGVHGHPLEIQVLFFGALRRALHYIDKSPENRRLIAVGERRLRGLRYYVQHYYWLDLQRLNELYRSPTEEFGESVSNELNIQPQSIPAWVADWLPDESGYLVGNLGSGRMDFRFFTQGNLLAVVFGLVTDRQAKGIMNLIEQRWDDLVGAMPVKLCYPALTGDAWDLLTGCDPKNRPWSYHNGGNWPVLLWPLVAAALSRGRRDLAERAFALAAERLPRDDWPEYYDGTSGRLLGRYANLQQTWSAAALILADKLLEDPGLLALLPE